MSDFNVKSQQQLAIDRVIEDGFLKSIDETTIELNEIFYSIQGETRDSGSPTVFVRTQFCPLRCSWCDTADSWKKGEGKLGKITLGEVIEKINSFSSTAKVCITGGEPLRQYQEVIFLSALLKTKGRYVTVETDGQEPIARIQPIVDSVVMDWKCPTSGMSKVMDKGNLAILKSKDQVKFIVSNQQDLEVVEKVLKDMCGGGWRLPDDLPEVLIGLVEGNFTVENKLNSEQVVEWMKKFQNELSGVGKVMEHLTYGSLFRFRFQTQLHKHIYGNKRGV